MFLVLFSLAYFSWCFSPPFLHPTPPPIHSHSHIWCAFQRPKSAVPHNLRDVIQPWLFLHFLLAITRGIISTQHLSSCIHFHRNDIRLFLAVGDLDAKYAGNSSDSPTSLPSCKGQSYRGYLVILFGQGITSACPRSCHESFLGSSRSLLLSSRLAGALTRLNVTF